MFKTRVLTALGLFAFCLPILFFAPTWCFALLCAGVMVIAAWEWGRLAGLSAHRGAWFYAAGVAAILVLSALDMGLFSIDKPLHFDQKRIAGFYRAALFFSVLAIPYILIRKPVLTQGIWHRFLLFGGVILLISAWHALLAARVYGVAFLLSLLAVVWLADSGAYFAGKRWGRRKLAPSISPGKTWEGVAGGMVLALLGAMAILVIQALPIGDVRVPTIFSAYTARFGMMVTGVFVALWVAVSIVGDIFESLLKRQAGVKDSGVILPGHGGILDRIDGLLLVLPLAMFFLPS